MSRLIAPGQHRTTTRVRVLWPRPQPPDIPAPPPRTQTPWLVVRRTVAEGDEEVHVANRTTVVSIRFTLTLEDGTLISSTTVGGDRFDYIPGLGQILPAIEEALRGSQRREEADHTLARAGSRYEASRHPAGASSRSCWRDNHRLGRARLALINCLPPGMRQQRVTTR